MKTRSSSLVLPLSILLLFPWAETPPASAQTRPGLALRFAGGQPTLSLTGAVGSVYSIQYASGLSPTNVWVDRTLLQAKGGGTVWSDPSFPAPSQRYYRAVSVPAPADTNLVFMQPGTFTMGSPTSEMDRYSEEGPQAAVTISGGFWMGKYLVTQGDFLSVVGSNPSYFSTNNGFSLDLTRPVDSVRWVDATAYCAQLTQQERAAGRIPTNSVYRLPTEAEWEYACRAETSTRFSYGDDSDYTNLTNYGWYYDNSGGTTHAVGQKLPNPWGLYDMHGNVFEWCQDWDLPYPGGIAVDPQGPATGTYRVIRGGGWGFSARVCRSAYRGSFSPVSAGSDIGFRVVLAQVSELKSQREAGEPERGTSEA